MFGKLVTEQSCVCPFSKNYHAMVFRSIISLTLMRHLTLHVNLTHNFEYRCRNHPEGRIVNFFD